MNLPKPLDESELAAIDRNHARLRRIGDDDQTVDMFAAEEKAGRELEQGRRARGDDLPLFSV